MIASEIGKASETPEKVIQYGMGHSQAVLLPQ